MRIAYQTLDLGSDSVMAVLNESSGHTVSPVHAFNHVCILAGLQETDEQANDYNSL